MNCYLHTETPAVAYCRSCGKPLCEACKVVSQGTVYCSEHAPVAASAAQPPPVPASNVSPGLAFLLGLVPGVGAVYNGQYVKGIIHVVILGVLISILDSGAAGAFEPLFGLLTALWFFYMAFEASHTASKRRRGEPVDEFSSLLPLSSPHAGSTAAAIALIILGVVFLLINLRPEWARVIMQFWPVAFIIAGVWMLIGRLRNARRHVQAGGGLDHEPNA